MATNSNSILTIEYINGLYYLIDSNSLFMREIKCINGEPHIVDRGTTYSSRLLNGLSLGEYVYKVCQETNTQVSNDFWDLYENIESWFDDEEDECDDESINSLVWDYLTSGRT